MTPRKGRLPLPENERKQQRTIWLTPDEITYLIKIGSTVQDGIRLLIKKKVPTHGEF